MHTAALHCQPLLLRHAKASVVVVRQFTVVRGIVGVPITVVVAALTALDADKFAGAGER